MTERIAIVRALRLGDLLCAVPALRVIRAAYPTAWIDLIGLPWASELPDRFPDLIDEHHEFPGFPGIPEAPFEPSRTTAFLRAAQGMGIDQAVQLHGSGSWSNAFTLLLGARATSGFVEDASAVPPGVGRWIPYPAEGHEIRRLLRLASAVAEGAEASERGAVAAAVADDHLEFPVRDADRLALADAMTAEPRLHRGEYVVVHPGASDPRRRWPAEWFARVIRALVHEGLPVVVTGSGDEASLAAEVAGTARVPIVDLTGRTGLGALGALIDDARLVVSNDTGISHVAAARRTPSIVVFTSSDPHRWAPLDGHRHIALTAGPPTSGPSLVTPELVVDAVRRQLGTAHRPAA